jgi:hypothetical protein
VNWSLRNNVNMQESAILFAMDYTATNKKEFLGNFYLKSKRSVNKWSNEGPAAWVVPSDDTRPVGAANLMDLLQIQGIEVQKTSGDTEVTQKSAKVKIPAGSYVIRMDQPYSRMADMLLDTQYYNINDPAPYDDTGWTLGALHNVKTIRVTDAAILKAPMSMVTAPAKFEGSLTGGTDAVAYLINNNTDNTLFSFRYRLKNVKMSALEAPYSAGSQKFNAGSFVIKVEGAPVDLRPQLTAAAKDLGLKVVAVSEMPKTAMHDIPAPRIALIHTWTNTQNEGWYRIAFDQLKIPYDYIADQKLKTMTDLRSKYDVILFGPVGGTAQSIINGRSTATGDPIPFKTTAITPNLGGAPDTTDDMRPGMGFEGIFQLHKFVQEGGLFITITGNVTIPIDYGFVEGVTVQDSNTLHAQGSVLNAVFSDKNSPIAYGYGDTLAVYFNRAPILNVGGGGFGGGRGGGGGGGGRGGAGGAAGGGRGGDTGPNRPSGRGTMDDPDIPQGRPLFVPPTGAVADEEGGGGGGGRGGRGGNAGPQPRVILRFADEKDLLVSGMLTGGSALAGKAAVVDCPSGKGHVLMFANNPMWRSETHGSYFLLFNAMLNFQHLDLGRPAGRGGAGRGEAQ